jgi:hypothetical protein
MSDLMGCSEMVPPQRGHRDQHAGRLQPGGRRDTELEQRGLFACTYYTIIKETLQKNPITGEEEQFYKPTDEQVQQVAVLRQDHGDGLPQAGHAT